MKLGERIVVRICSIGKIAKYLSRHMPLRLTNFEIVLSISVFFSGTKIHRISPGLGYNALCSQGVRHTKTDGVPRKPGKREQTANHALREPRTHQLFSVIFWRVNCVWTKVKNEHSLVNPTAFKPGLSPEDKCLYTSLTLIHHLQSWLLQMYLSSVAWQGVYSLPWWHLRLLHTLSRTGP